MKLQVQMVVYGWPRVEYERMIQKYKNTMKYITNTIKYIKKYKKIQ